MTAPAISFLNGKWIDQAELQIRVDDFGFFQGATAVERLRTWSGNLPPLEDHLLRFANSTKELRIGGLPATDELIRLIHQLLEKNAREHDFGITMFATPGRRGSQQPTLCLHLTSLDFGRISVLQQRGQPLVITTIQQPAPACWSRAIKVRCRLHYYLADLEANDQIAGGLGVLLDSDGSITETSTSNIIVCNGRSLLLPPEDRVLPGIMAKTVCRLANEAGWKIQRRILMPGDLHSAEEVWLTGSEVGLWFANQVDSKQKPLARQCLDVQRLLAMKLNGHA